MTKIVNDTNRLSFTHPQLVEEWDFSANLEMWEDNNKHPRTPHEVTYGTYKKVWWKCSVCSYKWLAFINSRSNNRNPRGCPACSGRVVTDKNRLSIFAPHLCKEWDYKRNLPFTPENVSKGSNKKVWWLCSTCGYEWAAVINCRAGISKNGCRRCIGRVLTDKNRLSVVNTELCKEWDFIANVLEHEKNTKHPKAPEEVSYSSNTKVWWKCPVCGYVWKAAVYNRSGNNTGCPACVGKVVTDENRLSLLAPIVALDWDVVKNSPITPYDISYASGRKVWWKCGVCAHEWKTTVTSRTYNKSPRGCPYCSGGPVSKMSQKWLDSFDLPQKNREVWLPELGIRVDGFDPKTNTVYEFLGDYWHGNPTVHCQSKKNGHSKKTFGQLFEETIERLFLLRRSGYNLNIIWEEDFRKWHK